jgi:hypothetical protein
MRPEFKALLEEVEKNKTERFSFNRDVGSLSYDEIQALAFAMQKNTSVIFINMEWFGDFILPEIVKEWQERLKVNGSMAKYFNYCSKKQTSSDFNIYEASVSDYIQFIGYCTTKNFQAKERDDLMARQRDLPSLSKIISQSTVANFLFPLFLAGTLGDWLFSKTVGIEFLYRFFIRIIPDRFAFTVNVPTIFLGDVFEGYWFPSFGIRWIPLVINPVTFILGPFNYLIRNLGKVVAAVVSVPSALVTIPAIVKSVIDYRRAKQDFKNRFSDQETKLKNAEKDCLENLPLLLSANNLDFAKIIFNEIIPTCSEQQGLKLKINLIEKLASLTQSRDASDLLHEILKDGNNAAEVLKYYLQVEPHDYNEHYANVMYKLGNLFYFEQQYKTAEQCLQNAIAASPGLNDDCTRLLVAIESAKKRIPAKLGSVRPEYQYRHVLMLAEGSQRPSEVYRDTIVMQPRNGFWSAYCKDGQQIVEESLRTEDVETISQKLPREGEYSSDLDLIKFITSKYPKLSGNKNLFLRGEKFNHMYKEPKEFIANHRLPKKLGN